MKQLMLPGGIIRKGEDADATATRELFEEVGVKLLPDDLSYYDEFGGYSPGKRDSITIFEVELDKLPKIKIDNREVVWAEFLTPEEVLQHWPADPVSDYIKKKTCC